MIKVLHYCPGFNYGGIESRLIDWYINTDRNQVSFVVIKLNDIESEKIKELKKLGGVCYNLPPFRFINIIKYLHQIKDIIQNESPKIVHVHNTETGLFVLAIAKACGVKTRILHARNTGFKGARAPFVRLLFHKMAPCLATDYWACSENAASWAFNKRQLRDVKIINNGIQLDRFCFNANKREEIRNEYNLKDMFIVGTVGRFSPVKNYTFLVEVFSKIYCRKKNARLMLVGEGDLKGEIEECCRQYNVLEKVIFIGMKENVWDYYMAFDVFIGTSLAEGFGTTAIEAQATGLPTFISWGFPETTVITNYAYRLDIKDGSDKWCQKLICNSSRNRSSADIELIRKAGFDAKDIGRSIQDFYLANGTCKSGGNIDAEEEKS